MCVCACVCKREREREREREGAVAGLRIKSSVLSLFGLYVFLGLF